ncbi:MAG: hypothetical protein KDK30_09875 [Leptospiraceae bacterium]|nr:hypothetical protein [Leptospiraceae bacterium]MCB1315027.1 hypothetical protein [Leptospiraceae bacterium]MCB1321625.1 hypothetical protein [Leptospiraceae bacterium]
MTFSDRQLKLIEAAAVALTEHLYFTPEEAVKLIGGHLRAELQARHTSFESLEASGITDRTVFVRAVVNRVSDELKRSGKYADQRIERAIREFMESLHRSWELGHA